AASPDAGLVARRPESPPSGDPAGIGAAHWYWRSRRDPVQGQRGGCAAKTGLHAAPRGFERPQAPARAGMTGRVPEAATRATCPCRHVTNACRPTNEKTMTATRANRAPLPHAMQPPRTAWGSGARFARVAVIVFSFVGR